MKTEDPKKEVETEKPKVEVKNEKIEKFIFRGGELVSFKLAGKDNPVSAEEIISLINAGGSCVATIDKKEKKIVVTDIGFGNYLSDDKKGASLDKIIPRNIVEKDKDGKDQVVPNPDIINA